ncbi:MAG TPA: phosphatase PAP2 family protein [Geothermobacteraceae bacterium]|nr:phosphatase PAP2 family protein [Geothermobacteraceae bacterium]
MRSLWRLRVCRQLWFLLLGSLALLSGCAAVPGQAPWGSRVVFTPGWEQLEQATVNALKDPLTWGPAAGALACTVGDLDRDISAWGQEQQPLFGGDPDTASDLLLAATGGLYLGSALLADSGRDDTRARNKLQGLGLGLTANLTTAGLSYGVKKTARRSRPDASDHESFPSGHSSLAATNAALFSANLDALPLVPAARTTLRGTGYALAWGTAWARIEAGQHYPSDVLAGLALGHFVARVAQDTLLPNAQHAANFDLQLDRQRLLVTLQRSF